MKNLSSVKLLFVVIIVATSLVAKAGLPPLKILPSVTLPYTFNAPDYNGYIDVDGNGTLDYLVQFYPSGTGFSTTHTYCHIMGISGNQVLSEYITPPAAPAALSALSGTPLSTFATMLGKGDLISSSSTVWTNNPLIFEHFSVVPDSPLGSNSTNGIYSGYMGIYYQGVGGGHYGWINVVIDPAGQWVTLNSTGSETTPGASIPAGLNDPFAVPIPIIASLLGFGLIGGGIWLKRRKKRLTINTL
jgi:hypothetical protein